MPSRELTKTEKKYNKKEIFVLKEVFDDADVDGSGEIDLAELRKALNKTNLGNAAEDMFKAIDKDGSKKIGFDEYLKVRSPVSPRPSPRRRSPHPRRRFASQPRTPDHSLSSLRLFRLPPQAYYRFATPQEIRDIMLWVYPPKVEKAAEVKRLSEFCAEIKSIFVLYDSCQQRVLDKKELVEALSATGHDDEEIEDMFEEFDADGNGEIDLEEFISMLEASYLN